MNTTLRIIVSGGGTGGHIFPAISIANAIKEKRCDAEILFIGAEGRMEMQRVPAAGYPIKALPVSGFDRKHLLKNIVVLKNLWKSMCMAKKIINDFKPFAAVGVGGYASAPALKACSKQGVPCIIHESNSYAGVTNKLLGKSATLICVAYDNMSRFFPSKKLLVTGNPVRQNLVTSQITRQEALKQFGLTAEKKTLLVVGGSLGARTINESVLNSIEEIKQGEMQVIWQTGKIYIDEVKERLKQHQPLQNVWINDFISDMAAAYKAADLVISRAGAGSISELCLLNKPAILVPSPNVAEDHQTKNALSLSEKNAAILVKDTEARQTMIKTAQETINNATKLKELSRNIQAFAHPNAAEQIADKVIELAEQAQAKRNLWR